MLIDARQFESPTLSTDICVVGGGAAGITLGLALRHSGLHVTIVESGGLERTPETDALNDATSPSIGGDYLRESRRRVLGGTTSHWTGMCLPLDRASFAARPWMPNSGWPIDADTLHPYYVRACQQLGLAPWGPDDTLPRDPELSELRLDAGSDRFKTRTYQVKRRFDFGEEFGPALIDAPSVTLLTHATVTGVHTEGSRVVRAVAQTLTGRTVEVDAKAFVLATGGIENARLLLAANETTPGALGGGHENAGRYCMDHPELTVAEALLWPSWDLELYMGGRLSDDAVGFGAFFPTDRQQRDRALLLTGVQLVGGGRHWGAPQDAAIDRTLASAAFTLDCERGATHDNACLPATVRARFFARCEQAPDADNRVVLGERRDAFGNRLPELQWRLGEREYASIAATTHALGRALYRAGIGRFRSFMTQSNADEVRAAYGPSVTRDEREAVHRERKPLVLVWGHHMGTTRMSETPALGVVDADCRVHGVDNLWIAGCSVFPTGGAANPTLTILALALRLADHLAQRIG